MRLQCPLNSKGHHLLSLSLGDEVWIGLGRSLASQADQFVLFPPKGPRQLAACSLRADSTVKHRWACWSCHIDPVAATEAGFSPKKSIWHSSIQQCYHWWQCHAAQSHWQWVRDAEYDHIAHLEIMRDMTRFPETEAGTRTVPFPLELCCNAETTLVLEKPFDSVRARSWYR